MSTENENKQESFIATKELLLSIFSFFALVFSKWRIWLSALLLGTVLSLIIDITKEKVIKYRSTIIFNLELGGSGMGSQLGGLASAFGLGVQSGGSSGELFTSQNFPTIVRSRAVLERALMKNVEVDGDTLLMMQYVMDSSDIKTNEWAGDLFHAPFTAAINYKFPQKDPKDFTELENRIMNSVYEKIMDVTTISPVKTTNSIMVLTSVLTNEKMVKKWVETVLETTEEFYVEMKTKKTRDLLKIQQEQLAKLQGELNSADSRLAQVTFENPYVTDPMGRMKETQINRKSTFLSSQYIAQLNTIEGLNRMLIEQTPIFTVMEETRLPLEREYSQSGIGLKLFSLAFFFLAIFGVVVADTYKKVMNS